MAHGKCKRTICPSCEKPTRTCLCSRIQTPAIENSVNVTILQHALESKHPLNSTRIARLGLKNLNVATVSDVNFEARFEIRLLEPPDDSEPDFVRNGSDDLVSHQASVVGETTKPIDVGNLGFGDSSLRRNSLIRDESEIYCYYPLHLNSECTARPRSVHEDNRRSSAIITATIGKNGFISSLSHIWMPKTQPQNPSFSKILDSSEAREALLSRGFCVKKLKKMQKTEHEECEFELEVPPGSALLFPSEKAVDINDRDAIIALRVKNLIVLDGTWAKARRVYSENPWLEMLPHVKLKVKEMSLYGEVRHQPKAGYLSTIESIVHALRAVGEDDQEGLDNLLEAFESMVGDQRRCKEERVTKSKTSPI